MGKPYKREIEKIDATYNWAMNVPIDALQDWVASATDNYLISVGSGGSYTAAIFSALLHQSTGNMAIHSTPLEIMFRDFPLDKTAILFITAGGRNKDLLRSFEIVAREEPERIMALCGTKNSLIKKLSDKYNYVELEEIDFPSGKDGFLATNSLLCFLILLFRAYKNFISTSFKFPDTLEKLVYPTLSKSQFLDQLDASNSRIADKETIIVLYGKWGKPAAFDLESKFTEAALGNVQVADYRNFAHGRHNWLNKRPMSTGIIALVTPEDKEIADKTLNLIPQAVPVVRLSSNEPGPAAAIDLLIKIFFIVKKFGDVLGIDPGAPHIPQFGRRLYGLSTPVPLEKKQIFSKKNALEFGAIRRKMRTFGKNYQNHALLGFWKSAYLKYLRTLERAEYNSIVLDYDGTLCETKKRFEGISPRIGSIIKGMVKEGITIGIATGRGKSVRLDLQKIIPKTDWDKVIIGYYNGSDIGSLADETHPQKNSKINPVLQEFLSYIVENKLISQIAKYELRPNQITVEPISYSLNQVRSFLQDIANKKDFREIQILESSHSLDVLAPGVSKLELVETIRCSKENANSELLCIGDKGKWPGNDYELLSWKYSLSVNTVSSDPNSCWNIAQLGHRGVQAATDYLQALDVRRGLISINQKILGCEIK